MLCFCDTETTGLEPKDGHLLEVAQVATDDQLVEKSYFTAIINPVGIDRR